MGAAKFIRGLVRRIDPERLTVVVNTGDDETFYGLHVSPDIDTVTYTLAGVVSRAQGWGLDGESFNVLGALARFYGKPWFGLGDRDLATHLYRTERMRHGVSLSAITAEIADAFGVKSRIIPMSDDRVRTFVKLRGRRAVPFQEYFVRGRARGAVEKIELRGIGRARVNPAVLRAIRQSGAVILAPSNPFVSLGPILKLTGVRAALRRVKPRVAAISPIVSGKTVKGPADKMLRGLGMEVSPLGVARLYRDIAGLFVLDNADRRYLESIERLGMRALATDTIMATPERAAALAEVVLQALEV
ncbi:2-phospho-L-lactate transferase [Candidatus Binatus sp.]|uniref:2-phospho-L-lactate transferase n=1 Tax=Candidatus Binatus sp. TaxID=2811406 RepID=UPI003BBB43FC